MSPIDSSYTFRLEEEKLQVMTVAKLLEIDPNTAREASEAVDKNDLPLIVGCLKEKDKILKNKALPLLQNRSLHNADVYPFWNVFREMLKSEDHEQRGAGIILIACNTRWDLENKIDDTIDEYLLCLNDKDPGIVRQCIQALHQILPYKKHLRASIAESLISVEISDLEETIRKPILIDILEALIEIRKGLYPDEVEQYISMALAGDLLDQEDKKQIKAKMGYMQF